MGTHNRTCCPPRVSANGYKRTRYACFDNIRILTYVSDPTVQKVTQLGHGMLLEAFQAHEIVREKILEEIVTRIITKADNVQNYFDLLSKISTTAPQPLLNALPKVSPPPSPFFLSLI